MTIEWLGEESGVWFGMMIEGVVGRELFWPRSSLCAQPSGNPKYLHTLSRTPDARPALYCACYIRTIWIVSPQKEPANFSEPLLVRLFSLLLYDLTATCEDHRESDCLHHCGTERRG